MITVQCNNFSKCYLRYNLLEDDFMIKRELYLEKIRGFYKETSLIKIIYGLRRSGKSVILTQIIEELKEQGVNNEKTIEREFGAYDVINDNHTKYVITLDKENYSRNGIIHINAIDFLMKDDF